MPARAVLCLALLILAVAVHGANVDVVIERAPDQNDITTDTALRFRIRTSQDVVNFTNGNILVVTSTGLGTLTTLVTGSGRNYTATVSGMSTTGTVTMSLPAGLISAPDGTPNNASTFNGAGITWMPATPGPVLLVTEETGGTRLTEGGNARRLSLALAGGTTLTGNLTVTVSETTIATLGTQLAITPSTIVFTPGSEADPRSVAVRALSDATVEGTQFPLVGFASAATADPALNGMLTPSVLAYVTDVDPALTTPVISRADDQPDTTTASSARYKIVFGRSVTGLTAGDFATSGNGAAGATVSAVSGSGTTWEATLSGLTSAGAARISLAQGAATDSNGNGTAPSYGLDDAVTYIAAPLVTLSSTATLVLASGGSAATYTVRLAAAPSQNVQVNIREGMGLLDDFAPVPTLLTIAPTLMIFTPANWNVEQTVTLQVATESPARTLDGWRTIRHLLVSTDSVFDEQRGASRAIQITPIGGSSSGGGSGGGGSTPAPTAQSTTTFGGGGCGAGSAAAALVLIAVAGWRRRRESRP